MIYFKKIIALICAVSLVLALAACGGSQNGTSDTADSSNNASVVTGDGENTVTDGKPSVTVGQNVGLNDYVIVKPKFNIGYVATLEIERLQKLLADKFGYNVSVIKDCDAVASEREIIVGAANRDGVEKIIDGDVVSVKVQGNKVYLNGGSTYSVAAAVTEFINMLNSGDTVTLNDASSKQTDYDTVAATIDNTKYYKATFREAFDTYVDLTKWNNYNDYNQYGQNGKWAKRAKEDYSNLSFVDGKFTTQFCYDDEAYYGSMLTTQSKMAFKYGYFEISQLTPKGQSFWTSLWTRPAFATSLYWVEIDVNENFGAIEYTRGNFLPWLTSKGNVEGLKEQGGTIGMENYYYPEEGTLYTNFHTFGCDWNEQSISFYRDGELLQKFMIDELSTPVQMGLRNQHSFLIIGAIAGSDNLLNEKVEKLTEEEWKNGKYIVDDVVVYQYADQDIQFDYADRHYGYTTQTHYND